MPASRLDRWLAPWVFVLTGIVFNILSAVITHYFIGLNDERLSELDRSIQDKQLLIDSQWQSRIEIERKKEFFLLFIELEPQDPELALRLYRDYLRELIDTHDLQAYGERIEQADMTQADLLIEISDAAREAVIELINNTYFESLELNENKRPLESANSRLFSIAIFLQVTGLILVLARDLRRRP